jgi:hypothetical protein
MPKELTYRAVYSLVLTQLAKLKEGNDQFTNFVPKVLTEAYANNLLSKASPGKVGDAWVTGRPGPPIAPEEERRLTELVRQALWQFVVKGLLVWGLNDTNPNFPFFRVTDWGKEVLTQEKPQPYDPDGFLISFRGAVGKPDDIVEMYLSESVQTFNVDCFKAAAVMLGCASERLILLFCEEFENAITDQTKKSVFKREIEKRDGVYHKYNVLKERLDHMVSGNKVKGRLAEIIRLDLPGVFNLLRRSRDEAGHPTIFESLDTYSVHGHLILFIDYNKKINTLIDSFSKNGADW